MLTDAAMPALLPRYALFCHALRALRDAAVLYAPDTMLRCLMPHDAASAAECCRHTPPRQRAYFVFISAVSLLIEIIAASAIRRH